MAADDSEVEQPSASERWIDLVIRRSDEMRRKGILSIGYGAASAVLAPAGHELDEHAGAGDQDDAKQDATDDPVNAWENPASYPTGVVPTLDVDDVDQLPEIPQFGDH